MRLQLGFPPIDNCIRTLYGLDNVVVYGVYIVL